MTTYRAHLHERVEPSPSESSAAELTWRAVARGRTPTPTFVFRHWLEQTRKDWADRNGPGGDQASDKFTVRGLPAANCGGWFYAS